MIRRLVGILALTVVLATGANAQIISFTDPSFHLNPFTGSGIIAGASANGLSGSFSTAHPLYEPYGAGESFQAWCVDLTHGSRPNTSWPVTVTMLNSTTFAPYLHDANAVPSYTDYAKAAWLTTQMSGTADTHLGNTSLQCAIWFVMGYNISGESGCNYGATQTARIATDVADAGANVGSIHMADWMIITQTLDPHTFGCNPGGTSLCNQEFLANVNVIPEPATMTLVAMGLVGMAGAGLRRRKNKK